MFALLLAACLQDAALSPAHLRSDLRFLSSDLFEGRRTGEFGADAAAAWIQSRFLRLGLASPAGGWQDGFPGWPQRLDPDRTTLTLEGDPDPSLPDRAWLAGDSFLPHPMSPSGSARGPLVFAGYAISSPRTEYDDLYGLGLKGSIALIFRWEPQAGDARSRFDGLDMLPEARLRHKIAVLQARGVAGILIADPPGVRSSGGIPAATYWPSRSRFYLSLNSLRRSGSLGDEDLADTNFTPADIVAQFFDMLQAAFPAGARVPVAFVGPEIVQDLFARAGRDAREWVEETDRAGAADGFPIPVTAQIDVFRRPNPVRGWNVSAILRGSDPKLSDEYVVIGAHYDHVGKNAAGEIWNGADDNGSGTVGLLALAEVFAHAPRRPRRSLVFVAFSAEEEGLLGASWWLDHEVVPSSKIVAMLNMDMIGRATQKRVHAVGTRSSPDLPSLIQALASGLDLHLDFENEQFFDRSDQAVFYYQGIPVVFLNTNEHEDYHKPTDTWEKVDYETASQICELARRIVEEIANRDRPPRFQDGYRRFSRRFGSAPQLMVPIPLDFEHRLDY